MKEKILKKVIISPDDLLKSIRVFAGDAVFEDIDNLFMFGIRYLISLAVAGESVQTAIDNEFNRWYHLGRIDCMDEYERITSGYMRIAYITETAVSDLLNDLFMRPFIELDIIATRWLDDRHLAIEVLL